MPWVSRLRTDKAVPWRGISLAEVLLEMGALANGSVDAHTRLRDFLKLKPVSATLKVDDTVALLTEHTCLLDEVSEEVLRCRAAMLADNAKFHTFCGGKTCHENSFSTGFSYRTATPHGEPNLLPPYVIVPPETEANVIDKELATMRYRPWRANCAF
jgi:hypothetical protein